MRFGKVLALSLVLATAVGFLSAWSRPSLETTVIPGDHVTDVALAPAGNFMVHRLDATDREELRCLALNIYWEARSEPVDGQLAVAAVTLNRVASDVFPNDICSVVRQGGEVRRHRCQFSWWCDGKRDEPLEAEAWRRAETLARLATSGVVSDPTDGALWYHADYVSPDWADSFAPGAKIGRHIFYGIKADETETADATRNDRG